MNNQLSGSQFLNSSPLYHASQGPLRPFLKLLFSRKDSSHRRHSCFSILSHRRCSLPLAGCYRHFLQYLLITTTYFQPEPQGIFIIIYVKLCGFLCQSDYQAVTAYKVYTRLPLALLTTHPYTPLSSGHKASLLLPAHTSHCRAFPLQGPTWLTPSPSSCFYSNATFSVKPTENDSVPPACLRSLLHDCSSCLVYRLPLPIRVPRNQIFAHVLFTAVSSCQEHMLANRRWLTGESLNE